jgi:hypothetical protein
VCGEKSQHERDSAVLGSDLETARELVERARHRRRSPNRVGAPDPQKRQGSQRECNCRESEQDRYACDQEHDAGDRGREEAGRIPDQTRRSACGRHVVGRAGEQRDERRLCRVERL